MCELQDYQQACPLYWEGVGEGRISALSCLLHACELLLDAQERNLCVLSGPSFFLLVTRVGQVFQQILIGSRKTKNKIKTAMYSSCVD